MQCRSCGMETRTTDVCEWCKKPMAGQSQPLPTMAMPPQPQPTMSMPPPGDPTVQMPPLQARRRVSLTGDVIEDVVPVAPPVRAAAPGHIPATAWDAGAMNAALKGVYSP